MMSFLADFWLEKCGYLLGERGNSVYARGLQVMEGKGRMGRPKHSGEKGE